VGKAVLFVGDGAGVRGARMPAPRAKGLGTDVSKIKQLPEARSCQSISSLYSLRKSDSNTA
jgi:hypothetical protein